MLEGASDFRDERLKFVQWKSPQELDKIRLERDIAEMVRQKDIRGWRRKKEPIDLFGIRRFKNKLK